MEKSSAASWHGADISLTRLSFFVLIHNVLFRFLMATGVSRPTATAAFSSWPDAPITQEARSAK
jgi:hypothetical protein